MQLISCPRNYPKAKMESRDHIVELLGEAEMRQRMGDMAGCEATLGDVERMLKP